MDAQIEVYGSRTMAVSVRREAGNVYEFVSNPENLPRWAAGLGSAIKRVGERWVAETPQGKVTVEFAGRNDLGVLDHTVRIGPGLEVYVPMRVVRNGGGSEILFTLFQRPGMTDEEFARDIGLVERDLGTLRQILEQ